MDGIGGEFERRLQAVRAVQGGRPAAAVARELGRSEWWIHKWLRRWEAEGEAGLRDRSRAPHHRPGATPEEVVAKILEVRGALEESEFGGVSADAILYELECQGFGPLPSRATVGRVLKRAGVTGKKEGRERGTERHRPRPTVDRPGVWQQADWVGPRYLGRRVSFSSLHLVDVGGGGAAAAQYPNERLHHAVAFLTERAWPALGIPFSLHVDGAFSLGPPNRKLSPWNVFVRACLSLGAEVVVSPPNELGWQNHVESFNSLWQARTIRRHRYESVPEVEASSDRFSDYYNRRRPHPGLQVATHGTRFPAALVEAHRASLRFPPEGFSVTDYEDRQGRLHLPLAKGRLTYLCRVQEGGVIEVAGAPFFVPSSAAGACVVATILPPAASWPSASMGKSSHGTASRSQRGWSTPTTPSAPGGSSMTSRAERCPGPSDLRESLSDVLSPPP